MITECGLQDLGFNGSEFTWEKSRGTDTWIQERLDRRFANQGWKDLFPSAKITVIEVSTSDHLPLLLQLNSQVYVPKTRKFRFENVWIQEAECINIVKNSWESIEEKSIMEKIEYYCIEARGVGRRENEGVWYQNSRLSKVA